MRRVGRVGIAAVAAFGAAALVGHAAGLGPANVDQHAVRLERPARTFSIVAAGDWLPEYLVLAAAAGFAPDGVRFDHEPLLRPIGDIVRSADLAICHMETPIGEPGATAGFIGRAPNGRSLIAAPYEVADDLAHVGFDRCTTASNHAYDLGVPGIDSTLAALDAAGITHAGTARSAAEASPRPFDVRGVAVANLSYARNTNTTWPTDAWRLSRATSAAAIAADVASARAAGAEVVIVSLHVFVEMERAPHPDDRALVTEVLRRADVDLVVAHGPHVVQPVEVVDGTPVFWSLGNLVSGMGVSGRGRYSDPRTLDGIMAAARFTERPDGTWSVEAAPVLMCELVGSRVVYPGIAALADPATPRDIRAELDACRQRSAAVVTGLR